MRGYAIAFLIYAVNAGPALADWVPMTGSEIQEALQDQSLQYEGAWQRFYVSGRTLYNAGHDSWGYWAVRGDQYCSQWPPGDLWECYDLRRDGDLVRFVGSDGSFTDGTYRE